MKRGDRVRVTGRGHPWKGATGTILRPYDGRGIMAGQLDWFIQLDPPHGFEAYGRESGARTSDLEPVGNPQTTLF